MAYEDRQRQAIISNIANNLIAAGRRGQQTPYAQAMQQFEAGERQRKAQTLQNTLAMSQERRLQESLKLKQRAAEMEQQRRAQMQRYFQSMVAPQAGQPVQGTQMPQTGQPVQGTQMPQNDQYRRAVAEHALATGDYEGAQKALLEAIKPQEQIDPLKGLSPLYVNYLKSVGENPSLENYATWQGFEVDKIKAEADIEETEFDKMFGKEGAKRLIDWEMGGGKQKNWKNRAQLAHAKRILEAPGMDLTGPLAGIMPDFVKSLGLPESITAREAVQEVAQQSLKEILGAQFGEKEGERLIQKAFNPLLPETENARRIGLLIQIAESQAATMESAANYVGKNRSLKGWRSPNSLSYEDIETLLGPEPKGSEQTPPGQQTTYRVGDTFNGAEILEILPE